MNQEMETLRGASVNVRSYGSGHAVLVIVHGWMVSGESFDAVARELAKDSNRTILVPDLPGTGGSPEAAESGYKIEAQAARIGALIGGLASDRPVALLGHSMGGQIAQVVAAELGNRLSGLALLCSVPADGLPLPDDARALMLSAPGSREVFSTILGLACKALPPDERDRLLDVACKITPRAITEGVLAWTSGDFSSRLNSITARTLVVASEDPFLPVEYLNATQVQPIAGATMAVVPGAGHYPHLERTFETTQILKAFLAGLGF